MSDDARSRPGLQLRALGSFRRYEPGLLVALATSVAVLTFIGAVQYGAAPMPAVIAALKALAGGNEIGQYGTLGNAATLLDFLLIFWVAVKTAMFAFANGIDSFRARTRSDHTVICGLGERGRTLAEALLAKGEQVTVVERDAGKADATSLRAQGGLVVAADATASNTLRLVRADRAERVVAVLPLDDQNAAVAKAVLDIEGEHQPPCFIHISDTAVWLSLFGSAEGRITPFSVADSGCSEVFLELDLVQESDSEGANRPPDLLVFGTGALAQSIIMRAAKVWQAESVRMGTTSPLPVRIVGAGATTLASDRLRLRYSGIERLSELTPIDTSDFDDAELVVECAMTHGAGRAATAIVAAETKEDTVRCVLLAAKCLPAARRIVAVVPSASMLLRLLESRDQGLAERLSVVDLSRALWDTATLFGGPRKELARLTHESYVRSELRKGGHLGQGSLQYWDDLSAELRDSNEDQVRGLFEIMLPELGAGSVPLAEWDPNPFIMPGRGEVERLAALEHERWCEWARKWHWTLDEDLEKKDTKTHRTPLLVPFERLPEDEKDKDRNVIRSIPTLLARAGFRLESRAPR